MAIEGDSTVGGATTVLLTVRRRGEARRVAALRGAAGFGATAALAVDFRVAGRRAVRRGAALGAAGRDDAARAIS